MEHSTDRATRWRITLRRALGTPPSRRRRGWSSVVPLIAALAGLLFTTTARTAAGTALRDDRRPELTRLIEEQRQRVERDDAVASRLRVRVDAATRIQAGSDVHIDEQQRRIDASAARAGLTPVHGPGITVRLDDAPRPADGSLPPNATVDDIIVHQQDVQSVVNALWTGGAEAMTIMGVRVISTSAVRCVGNTLLLHGRVHSPPFTITAIGDPSALRAALDADQGVQLFRDAASAWGLGYQATEEADVELPGYRGSIDLAHAQVSG